MTVLEAPPQAAPLGRASHPVRYLLIRRVLAGIFTLWVVSTVVFAATQVLPGNAAYAILGHTASPARVHALELQLHLNRGFMAQYTAWIGGVLTGHMGVSLASGQQVTSVIGQHVVNSAILVAISGAIGTAMGLLAGILAAVRRGGILDDTLSVIALAITALPEFVVAVALVIILSTVVFHVLPPVSILPPGTYAWSAPSLLVLPALTLIIVIFPYIFRMTRAAMIEALESDYVEMANLKGVPTWRVLSVHALLNAIPPVIQVIGLNFLYLAGGIVVVEYVFDYPGIGQALVSAVSDRDVPVIQATVLVLAAFYVFMNIVTDVVALLAVPRRRVPR
jgi:peptide/nickel transport system permease protein